MGPSLPSLPFHPSSRVGHFGGPSTPVREAAEMASGSVETTPSRPRGKGAPSTESRDLYNFRGSGVAGFANGKSFEWSK